jgi:peptidoglycan/xylan/chitin deacetylase (PgdA/CDA1 family)
MFPAVLRSIALLLACGSLIACAGASDPIPAPRAASALAPAVMGDSAAAPRLTPLAGHRGAGERSVAPERGRDAALVARDRTRAVVLLYHAFDVGPEPLGISSQRFEHQLERLERDGVVLVPLSALVEFLEGARELPERVAVITIDDAHRSVYRKAFPILRRRGAPFSLGIPTAFVGKKGLATLAWDQIREMRASGLCELASHGHRHRRLGALEPRAAAAELELSRELIERETGVRPIAYFYPLGAIDSIAERRVLDAGYRAAFGATGGAIAFNAFSRFRVPRTTVHHHDRAERIAWLFSPRFLERLPRGAPLANRASPEPTLIAD